MISRETDEQIKFFYKKSFNEMFDIEKQQITDISLNHKTFNGKNTETAIVEILEFTSLRKCTINGFNITDEDIKILNKSKTLKEIQFSNCNFININISLKNIEILIIDNCKGVLEKVFEKLEELEFLQIVAHEKIDIREILKCKKIKRLYLQDTEIKKLGEIKGLQELEYVNLDKSRFNQIDFALLKHNSKFKVDYDKDAQIKMG